VVLLILALVFGAQAAKKRRLLLEAWARSRGLRFRPEHDARMEDRFPLFSCLRVGDRRYAFNIMRGGRRGRGVCAFDYHYETSSTDSKGRRTTTSHYFSCVVVSSGLPLKPLSIRPEGFFDRITQFFGYDDIDFELGEFSRRFYVKAPDRRWAFDVLHQETMEFLLDHRDFTTELAGPWVMVRKSGRLEPEGFSRALDVAEGILDRLPEYLLRELKGVDA
jgi:hypothetical protein